MENDYIFKKFLKIIWKPNRIPTLVSLFKKQRSKIKKNNYNEGTLQINAVTDIGRRKRSY